jgi:hypothetical protein
MKNKFSINRLTIAFASLLLVAVLYSCVQRPFEYEIKQQIVKDKTIYLKNGNTRYNIAFEDGSCKTFDFGLFTKYEIGDTICFKRKNDAWGFWYIEDCH